MCPWILLSPKTASPTWWKTAKCFCSSLIAKLTRICRSGRNWSFAWTLIGQRSQNEEPIVRHC